MKRIDDTEEEEMDVGTSAFVTTVATHDSASSTPSAADKKPTKPPSGKNIGIIVGVVFGVIILVALLYYLGTRKPKEVPLESL